MSADQPAGEVVELLHEGRRHRVGEAGVLIGSAQTSAIRVSVDGASDGHHARVFLSPGGGVAVEELSSAGRTLVNGRPLRDGPRVLATGDRIEIGDATVLVLGGGETQLGHPGTARSTPDAAPVEITGDRLSIGRQPGNDLLLDDPNVSRAHAELRRRGVDVELVDLGSRNGTRLDGKLVERAVLAPGATIGIGPFSLRFDGRRLVARDDRGDLRLVGEAVSVRVADKQILEPVSVSVSPGELIVLIGESGAGKSTLLKVLAGVNAPSQGVVSVNGDPVAARLTDVGYVPQDEIVHPDLTVDEALLLTARLRLPDDTSAAELRATVARVVEELGLTQHAQTRIGSLSGGQRKRAGVAAELLSDPGLLFLDEPTTGLDPGLEARIMALLRRLADRGRGLVVVTHATGSLALCDRIVVMGAGGIRAFDGPPADALRHFGVSSFEGIYDALEAVPATEWRARFEAAGGGAEGAPVAAARVDAGAVRTPSGFLAQARVLTRRQTLLTLRDRQNLALLFGQVPVLALLNGLIFGTHIFDRPGGSPADAIQLLFLLVLAPIWFGALTASREIVKERTLRLREAAVGVRVRAYLASKLIVLCVVVAIQTLLMVVIVFALRPLHEPFAVYIHFAALMLAVGFAATAMGLLVSALVSSEDQAASVIPLVLIPQFLFAGAIVPVARMLQPFRTLSYADPSQWGLAALGRAIDVNGRVAEVPSLAATNRYGTGFFDVGLGGGILAMAVFLSVFLGATALVLRRRGRL